MTAGRSTSRTATPPAWTCSTAIPRPGRYPAAGGSPRCPAGCPTGSRWTPKAACGWAAGGAADYRGLTPPGPPPGGPPACSAAPGLDTLYITTARENFTSADLAAQPHAGDIFACHPSTP